MKQTASILIALLTLLPLWAGEREATYLKDKCLPLVREFLRHNQIPFEVNFPTNAISHWRTHF